jgi:hypothetical protein
VCNYEDFQLQDSLLTLFTFVISSEVCDNETVDGCRVETSAVKCNLPMYQL